MRLGPHLHRIGNDIVAAYLLDREDGITVIDTGLPGHWEDLLTELQVMDRSLDDVRGVILTHGDSDHIGFAETLRQERGIPVFVHSLDAERARGGNKPKTAMGPKRIFPLAQFALYGLRKRGWHSKYLTEVTEVADGDVLTRWPNSPQFRSIRLSAARDTGKCTS